MTTDYVLDLIRKGAGQTIEFKEKMPQAKELARELCAFANFNDGYIIIGVTDRGEVTGYKWDKKDDEYIVNVGSNNCEPHIIPVVYKVDVNKKLVVVLEVLRGENRPYKANNVVYIRENSVTRPVDRERELRLLQNGGHIHFDMLPVKNGLIEDLNKDMVDAYLKRRVSTIALASFSKKRDVLLNLYYLSKRITKLFLLMLGY